MAGGRHKEFNEADALHAAMLVFWKQGYAGASLAELTAAMGINKPSLYATFGNKEQLFVAATHYYIETLAAPHINKLRDSDKPLTVRLKNYLMSLASMICDPALPGGCFISLSASETAGDSIPTEALAVISKACSFSQQQLQEFFNEEIAQKNIAASFNAQNLTLFMLTLMNGSAAMARNGSELKELEIVYDIALKALLK